MRVIEIISLLALCGCASGVQPASTTRDAAGYREAKRTIRGDALSAFRIQLAKGQMVFYAMREHLEKGKWTFPGLSQKEVDEFITEGKTPIEVRFEDVAPVVVGAQFSGEEYWLAVDDFLSDYNRLVLAELKRRAQRPIHSAEPSSPRRAGSP